MNRSSRSYFFLAAGCLLALAGVARPSQAHFLWLKAAPAEGQTQALLFFGESADDEAYHLPDKLAATKVWRRTADGKRTELKTQKVETEDRIGLVVPLPDGGPSVLETSQQYGVYEDWLLTYYAKHIQSRCRRATGGNGPVARVEARRCTASGGRRA